MDSSPARGLDWEAVFRQRSTPHLPPAENCDTPRAHRCRQRRRSWATGAAPAPCAGCSKREAARSPWSKASLPVGVVPPTPGPGRPTGLRQHEACRWHRPRRHLRKGCGGHVGARARRLPPPALTPRQRCRQVFSGGRSRDARTWRATVRCTVEARTPARAGGTDLPGGHRAAGSGRHIEAWSSPGRRAPGRTRERPGGGWRALMEHGTLDEGAGPGAAQPPERCERPRGAPLRSTCPASRRRVEVGEDIRTALRCPAACCPAGGRRVDAGWRRRPPRCRRRNPGDDERDARRAVTPLPHGVRVEVSGRR